MPSGASSRKSLAQSASTSVPFAGAPSPDFLAERSDWFTSSDQALADRGKKQRAQAVEPAPEEKKGARAVACPGCGFSRSERHADSQAELPLIILGGGDYQEVPAAAGARRILEMWRVEEIGSVRAELHVEPLGEFERAE